MNVDYIEVLKEKNCLIKKADVWLLLILLVILYAIKN